MNTLESPPASTIAGFLWPAQPGPAGQAMLATMFQLDLSQWWAPAALVERQFQQIRQLVAYATAHCPHYANHLVQCGVANPAQITPTTFLRWPLLEKRDIQALGGDFLARHIPVEHGGLHWVTTSGSTGTPLRTATTDVGLYFQHAMVMRSYLWYGLDFSAKFAAIRIAEGAAFRQWGVPASAVFRTGPLHTVSALVDHGKQLEWLCNESPGYLLTLNTNLRALLDHSRRSGRAPAGLRAVLGFADMAAPEIPASVRELWNAVFFDTYSCSEIGTLALQCPQQQQLHVQSERVYLEVLRADGTACEPGEIGRVVVTDLHNFAMPLIRYELHDHALLGPPCPCGRGLPVLSQLAGRTSDLAVDPTGRSYFAHMNKGFWVSAAPIRQRQIVQHTPAELEVRYVAERELGDGERAVLTQELRTAMRYDYEIRFTRVAEIALGPGGKFEDFKSLLAIDDRFQKT